MYNHSLTDINVNFKSKTGSRDRVRVPVMGASAVGINPGDKVLVSRTKKGAKIERNTLYGNYTVEKDGAIRFPAWKFGLKSNGIKIKTTQTKSAVVLF